MADNNVKKNRNSRSRTQEKANTAPAKRENLYEVIDDNDNAFGFETDVETVNKGEINLDERVTVTNLAGWEVTFPAIHSAELSKGVLFAPNSSQVLTRNEIIAQVNSDNTLFTGSDGKGSHATLYIKDSATRRYIGFDTDDEPQKVFTLNVAKRLFKLSQAEYEAALPEYIVTRAEKFAFIEAIKQLNFNDYRKMIYAVEYCGFKL